MSERSHSLSRAKWICGAVLLAGLLGPVPEAGAVKTSYWKSDNIDAFLQGESVSGVSIESDGYLTLGPAWDSVATRIEGVSYIWCLVRDSKGRVVFGTGDEGGIYRWSRGGKPSLLWATGAPEITCMTVDRSDNVYAGSAPGGTIFRVSASGDTTRYFDTGEESVWSLAIGQDGALYAGTGSNGKIFRITGAGKGALYAETKDVNVLALAWAKDGALLAGTGNKGLLLRVERGGASRVIYDGGGDEIRAIAVLEDGSIAVASNRGRTPRSSGSSSGGDPGSGDSRYAVEVTPHGSGGKCGVFLVQPDGSARLLYAPPTSFIYAMIPDGARSVLAATGDAGALFRIDLDGKYALLGAPDEKQVLALIRSGGEMYAGTGNDAVLYALGSGPAQEGTFTSEANDLHSVATFGKATITASGGGEVFWSSRSGMSQEPDDGWSSWTKEVPVRGDVPIESPPARFLQYRLRIRKGGEAPVVNAVEVAYLQLNLPPMMGDVQVFGPENPYMEGGPEYRPPQISQVYPNGLKVEFSYPRSGPRQVSNSSAAWARGIRSVSWDAADPNGDDLSYVVSVKAEDEKEWRTLVDDYDDRVYSWDSESFPNGKYRLKVEASDAPDNPPPSALTTSRVSPIFEIDNLPPQVVDLRVSSLPAPKGGRPGVAVTGTAVDADSRIDNIEYAVDWGEWTPVLPLDKIFDSREEKFRFEVKDLEPGEHTISVRASDAQRNVAAAKILTTTTR
jgi:hypothetical protein